MHTVREKRRGGARPAALAVAVIAAMLVPAGAAAADTISPTEDSGVVAEQPAAEQPAEPVAAEPATTEPATTEPVAAEPTTTEPVATEPTTTEPVAAEQPDTRSAVTTSSTTTTSSTEQVTTNGGGLETMSGSFSFTGVQYDPEEEWTTAKVGTRVDAVPSGEWPSDASYDIDWYTDGGTWVGNGLWYKPTQADAGKDLSIAWTVTAPGYEDANGGMSVAQEVLPGVLDTMYGQLVVGGAGSENGEQVAYVDRTLTVALDAQWPAGADVTWMWEVGGILRSTTSSFTPDVSDMGRDVWVYADVSAAGYEPRFTGVRVADFVVEAPPVQQGTVTYPGATQYEIALGGALSVGLNGWPSGADETIVWYVNGDVRAEGRTFTPTAKDLGREVDVFVKVTAAGMNPYLDHRWIGTVVTTPTVSVPSSTIAAGDTAVIPVKVTGPANGPVVTGAVSAVLTPKAGGQPVALHPVTLVDGVATFSVPHLAAGTYTVDASYVSKSTIWARISIQDIGGSRAYLPATGTGTLKVVAATPTLSAPGTVQVAVATRGAFDATVTTQGQPLPESWTVREGGSILVQGEVRKGGAISVTLSVLSVGTHTLVLSVPATELTVATSRTITVTVTGEPAQVGTTPTVGTVLATPKAATVPGQQMELVAEGFEPGETVAFYLHSEPMFLGTAVAGADGVARLLATVPAGAPVGSHTVIATGGTSGRWATLAVELAVPAAVTPVANPVVAAPAATAAASPALAVTGSQSGTLMAGAWLMLLVGGGLVLVARRVRATR